MLRDTKDLYGQKIAAADGEMGHVKDFYFDDETWVIRYLIVDTGSWLTGRLVLLSPYAFEQFDAGSRAPQVRLTKAQIEQGPPIDAHRPVSRQDETDYYRHYGWPAYWEGAAMWGASGYPMIVAPTEELVETPRWYRHRGDKHLQSARAVTDYAVQTTDWTIGHVSSFLFDPKSWGVRDLVVETGHWYAGKEILIASRDVKKVSYDESKVFVNLTKADIQKTPEHEVARAGA